MVKLIKKIIYIFFVLVIIASLLITAGLSYLLITNYDNLGRAVSVVGLIKAQTLEPINDEELIEGAIIGMVGALKDPYSSYLDRDTYKNLQEKMEGVYGGVGLLITKDADGNLVVVAPFRGTPAHRAGIVSGDFIVGVNGDKTYDMTLEEAASLMQGEPGTDVAITTYRENRGELEIVITREIITIPTVDGAMLEEYPGVGYINISMFNENTGDELERIYNDLQQKGIEMLVLDLRNNPGGSLYAAVDVADFFIPKGPILYIETKFGTDTYDALNPGIDIPMIVLVNAGSASASEIVAGAIQDTGVGILVGEQTFGKGRVQSVFPLADGAALKLTTARYLTPSKRDINDKGIAPDYIVEMTPEDLGAALLNAPDVQNDAQLQKALELLKSF